MFHLPWQTKKRKEKQEIEMATTAKKKKKKLSRIRMYTAPRTQGHHWDTVKYITKLFEERNEEIKREKKKKKGKTKQIL